MNKLLALRRVDDNGPATKDLGSGVFQVEPGDMTRYTVQLGASHALAFVGPPSHYHNELERDRLVCVVYPQQFPTVRLGGRGCTDYTFKLLEYFCHLAWGMDVDEPEGLAERRKHVAAGS